MRHARRPHNQVRLVVLFRPKVSPNKRQLGQRVAELQREVAQLREEMAQVAQAAYITVVDYIFPVKLINNTGMAVQACTVFDCACHDGKVVCVCQCC